ncbi:MAG: hypothetical protein ACM3QZ_01730 [Solirubrobacterales bacterium]
MKKKLSILILMSVLVLAMCATAFGAQISDVDVQAKPQLDKPAVQVNEYDAFIQMQAKSDEELRQNGLTDDQIAELRNFDYAAEIQKKAKMTDRKLKAMGYDSERISGIRSFNGSEAQVRALSATLSLSCSTSQYFYRSGKTYAVVNYSWSWNQMPFFTMTDILGIVWNPSFYQTPNNSNDTQTISTYIGSSYVGTYRQSISCKAPGHGAGVEFPLLIDEWSNKWAKSATGKIYLAASGYVPEFGVRVSYGHTTINAGSPSISFPAGLSISFSGGCSEEASDYDYRSL